MSTDVRDVKSGEPSASGKPFYKSGPKAGVKSGGKPGFKASPRPDATRDAPKEAARLKPARPATRYAPRPAPGPYTGPDPAPNARQAPPRASSPLAAAEPEDHHAEGVEGERIAKALARAGVASRREVERYIAEGRVAVNGRLLTSPAVKIAAGDVLTVDGAVINEAEPTRLWRYHKPVGLLTTHNDPNGRPTVFENLPQGLPRVISVGRLDLNSEGLLLLTNDGSLARALELPKSGWIRRYRVRAFGRTDQKKLDELAKGVVVEGVTYGAIEARLDKVTRTESVGGSNVWITVAIAEGKNREVRRVMESIGLKVNRLIRLAYGPFALAILPTGAVEEVGPRVIRELLADFIAPENMPKGDRTAGPVLAPSGGRSRRNPDRPAEADGARRAAEAPVKEKKVYKAGWAKAAPKKGPAKAAPKPGRSGKAAKAGAGAQPSSQKGPKKR